MIAAALQGRRVYAPPSIINSSPADSPYLMYRRNYAVGEIISMGGAGGVLWRTNLLSNIIRLSPLAHATSGLETLTPGLAIRPRTYFFRGPGGVFVLLKNSFLNIICTGFAAQKVNKVPILVLWSLS